MPHISTCRFCQHYAPEGRRGGICLKLHAPVQADWSACPLVHDPFNSEWDDTVPLISQLAYHQPPKRQALDDMDDAITIPYS